METRDSPTSSTMETTNHRFGQWPVSAAVAYFGQYPLQATHTIPRAVIDMMIDRFIRRGKGIGEVRGPWEDGVVPAHSQGSRSNPAGRDQAGIGRVTHNFSTSPLQRT